MIKNVSNLLKICLYFDCVLFISYVKKSLNLKHLTTSFCIQGFPDSSVGKESACNAGDRGSIHELGRFPGEGKGYPLQYSGLENSRDCIVHGVTRSWTRLSDFHFQPKTITSVSFLT